MKMSTNKTIAKNTIFLYFRMMVTMLVTLYTSRVVLQVLGVDDFGLYAVVGGVVGMLAFANNALNAGTSRFLTFELGAGNFEKLQKTFSTLLSAHIILTGIIVVLAETVGLWFVYNKLSIPPERMDAALWVYHISVLAAMVTMTQIPYNGSIMAHEKMKVFAYFSILEVSLKLGKVYLLQLGDFDRLKFYAVLHCMVTIGVALFYRFYCISNFRETHYKFMLDKKILKSVGGYSGWNMVSQISFALNSQGMNIITNMFFNPAVVASRVISAQVNMAAMQFINNFRIAVNTQIVKKYAAEDYEGSKQLLLHSTKFSFYLMLLLGLPIILLAEPLLHLWLGQVPEYSVIFLQLIIIQSLFSVIDTSFITAFQAKGRLRENALISPMLTIITFFIVYFLFKAGFPPVTMFYAAIVSSAILGLVIKPILVCKIVDYTFRDIMSVFAPCMKVCLAAIPIPVLLNYFLVENVLNFFVVCMVSSFCVLAVVFYLGIDRQMRYKIICVIKEKLK